jgi:hypothetical protein
MRTPIFELHILPMFRATDREHMRNMFGEEFDLWDYQALKNSIERVLGSLERSMPPAETGGPWPVEWILLLHRWKSTGFKRLKLATGRYEVLTGADVVELQATTSLPGPGWRGWLQLDAGTESSRTYVFYLEPPDEPESGSGEELLVSEQFARGGIQKLFVRDDGGLQELAIPATPEG